MRKLAQKPLGRPVMPFVVIFREKIDDVRKVPNPRLSRITSEAGRMTSYED